MVVSLLYFQNILSFLQDGEREVVRGEITSPGGQL